jgi:hypothetical protein
MERPGPGADKSSSASIDPTRLSLGRSNARVGRPHLDVAVDPHVGRGIESSALEKRLDAAGHP